MNKLSDFGELVDEQYYELEQANRALDLLKYVDIMEEMLDVVEQEHPDFWHMPWQVFCGYLKEEYGKKDSSDSA